MYAIIRTIADQAVQTAYHRTCRIELSELFWQATKGHRPPKEGGLIKRELKKLKIEKDGYRHGIQKILLGMLVQYPEFIDEKSEAIERVEFDSHLEQLRSGLYQLLVDYGDLSVSLIYEKLDRRFYEVLNEVHGDRTHDRQRGHELFRMFPVLAYDPSPDFVSRCMDHFVHVLHVEQMVDELAKFRASLGPSDPDVDAITDRIIALKRDIQFHCSERDVQDMALAEEATEIKRVGRRIDRPLPSRQVLESA
jgi:DNA primase